MKNLFLYLKTIRFLKSSQLWHQLVTKLSARGYKPGRSIRNIHPADCDGTASVSLHWFLSKPRILMDDGSYSLLNVNYRPSSWDDKAMSDLWIYNLNYLDFLLQENIEPDRALDIVKDFVNHIPDNRIADDPYPISMRGINWVKFVQRHPDISCSRKAEIDAVVLAQYRWLAKHTERHLLANHYLENGFSLFFGAFYFKDQTLLRKAKKILYSQLKEQILDDGGHFELSPMYHCVIFEHLLDCYNLVISNPHFDYELHAFLLKYASRMYGWLDAMVFYQSELPLLNDAAYGLSPMPSHLLSYAHELGIPCHYDGLMDSGYRRFNGTRYQMVADVGPVGARYNAGHAHADTFNYVMYIDKSPFIIDTGTSEYTPGKRRSYERSTAAHNTVCVDGRDSSHVWGAFRCAERANVKILRNEWDDLEASHDGYCSLGLTVRRRWQIQPDQVSITDMVLGKNRDKHTAVSYIHLNEHVEILSLEDAMIRTSKANILFEGAKNVELQWEDCAFAFGFTRPCPCIKITFTNRLQVKIIPMQK